MAQPRKFPFSDDRIEKLPIPRVRAEYADTGCRGLRLRVGSSGVRSFIHYDRDSKGRRRGEVLGRWSREGIGGTLNAQMARARYLDARGALKGLGRETATVGELLDFFVERGKPSVYAASVLRKHLVPVAEMVATTLAPAVLSDLVAKVQARYAGEDGRKLGGPAVADKVRGGLCSMFSFAQRQGRFPQDRALPTLGLVRGDFKGIGWKAREREDLPDEGEVQQLLAALGVGTGDRLEIDLDVNPRISLQARLAILFIMHAPVRSGAGALLLPADAADLSERVLRWTTAKGKRETPEELVMPLSSIALNILRDLRAIPGGRVWLVPSPEDPKEHMDLKALSHTLRRLQAPGPKDEPPRVQRAAGRKPFTPHALRGLWRTLAGNLQIDDGIAVRVLGHKPTGGSSADSHYDHSDRFDAQREAVERVSAELERIRRRKVVPTARIVPLRSRR